MQPVKTQDRPPEIMDTPKTGLPVTIITGFLGSGKTTLLNHILTNQKGLKTAVLVNEFGEIGIDNELIVKTDETMVELNNGCICCTINEDLVQAVYKILERPEKIDYLVVETTGLADPLPVALTFLGTELRDMTRLDSIVTMVDCANFSLDLFNSQAAYSQIAYGDIIVLNKTDLVDEADVDAIEVKVRDVKEAARILRTEKSQVPLPLILSVGLFESDQYFAQLGEPPAHPPEHERPPTPWTRTSPHPPGHEHPPHPPGHEHPPHPPGVEPPPHPPGVEPPPHPSSHDHSGHSHEHHDHHDHHHHHSDHLENDGFTSLSFASEQPFSIRKFQYFLDNQLPSNVFRAKGILWFDESPKRHVFHLSGKRFTIEDDEWKGSPKNQLVLIGQDLDRDKLKEQIDNCLCLPSTSRGKGFG